MVPESRPLSEFFQLVKKPKYVLGTTYTLSLAFFESVVYPRMDSSELISCLIVSDATGYQRALQEGPALQGAAQEYMVAEAPGTGCFHAKVWLIVSETEMALLAGSGNLTQSGFILNAEMFDALHYTVDDPPHKELLDDAVAFLSGLSSMWADEASGTVLYVETLSKMRAALKPFEKGNRSDASAPRFMHNLGESLLNRLPPDSRCKDLFIAAPFFGGKTRGLDLLSARCGKPRLHIFPAVHDGKTVDLPVETVKKQHKPAELAPLTVPGNRPLIHLKLYGMARDEERSWLLCTSANCTDAAWDGANIEAGILRSVPTQVMRSYFSAENEPLPSAAFRADTTVSESHALAIRAVDTGAGFDLTVSGHSRARLPLSDVSLVVRSGSHDATCKKKGLLERNSTTHVPWTDFGHWTHQKNAAARLELTATDSRGAPVSAACFVENRMLLTAEPVHRSAWRGALALLDAEAMPDLSDVLAIFSLVRGMLDGTGIPGARIHEARRALPSNDTGPDSSRHVPLWPPQPDLHELHKHIGTTGLAHIQWCQRIMQTLLRPEISGHEEATAGRGRFDAEADDQSDAEPDDPHPEEVQKVAQTLADRLWGCASKDFDRLCERLGEIVPDDEMARNLWPTAIFVFLATMAVRQAVARIAGDNGDLPQSWELVHRFFRIMLHERKQDPDFCCPLGLRYRSEVFPALADDLWKQFGVRPHPDLAAVMVSVIAVEKLHFERNINDPRGWRELLHKVSGDGGAVGSDARETCLRIWRQYLRDEADGISDAEFAATFDLLTAWGMSET